VKDNEPKPSQKEKLTIYTEDLLFSQETVAYSVSGLPLYALEVTKRFSTSTDVRFSRRKRILISARVHAGETHSSCLMEEFLTSLITNCKEFMGLLGKYIFVLVPMLNPDGVVIGNTRSSLIGVDLNRRWTEPHSLAHPEVYFLKWMMKDRGEFALFCDLHGHNKKLNCFFYGNHRAANEGLISWTKVRLLPKIMDQECPFFHYVDCRFRVEKGKLNTARVVCWNELKISNSFTLETSMFALKGESLIPFSQDQAALLVKDFLNALVAYD